MGFWLAESNANGTINMATARLLQPGPSKLEYGQRFAYTIQETQGFGIQQRFKKKTPEMKWIWEKYNPNVPRYENLYWDLFNQQSHVRAAAGSSPYIWLKEDATLNWGKFDSVTTHKIVPDYIRVLVTYVGRSDVEAGGNVRYTSTELRFLLSDTSISEIV